MEKYTVTEDKKISIGYTAPEEKYDAIQRNIRINHLQIIEKRRGRFEYIGKIIRRFFKFRGDN